VVTFFQFYFGGNILAGIFWREYFGRIFWQEYYVRSILSGIFWREYFGRNILVGIVLE
jgi:hypothetical protein